MNVATCFIFTEVLDEEHCLCLRMAENGQVEAPLAVRSMSEVKALQVEARTIVVVPTASSGLYEVDLPRLSERKARAAIPFALEEQLAQNVTTLHFSFDKLDYQNNRYLVIVTDKQFLMDLLARLDDLDLDFDLMTLDWFALNPYEAFLTASGMLIFDDSFKGALSGELATLYLSQKQEDTALKTFNDTSMKIDSKAVTHLDCISSQWIAERLMKATMINLCQGDMQRGTRQQVSKFWYKACGVVLLVWLISILIMNAFYLHALSSRVKRVDDKIAALYHEFFPHAEQIISPKFRIGQLLKTGLSNGGAATLWILLDKLSQAVKGGSYTINEFRFQNQMLSVILTSKNFADLETLQLRLQRSTVKVRQAQASSHEQQVIATMELSL